MTREPTAPEEGRRKLLNYFVGTTFGATLVSILYPVVEFLIPPSVPEAPQNQVVADTLPGPAPNTGEIFKFGTRPGILIRTPGGDLRAFDATCTHLDCTVQYRPDLQRMWCACHGGEFDLNGQNVAGPPPRPLERFVVNTRGQDIVVTKEAT
jgi:Rieske Fe-S protein